jgi:hypothetical protein
MQSILQDLRNNQLGCRTSPLSLSRGKPLGMNPARESIIFRVNTHGTDLVISLLRVDKKACSIAPKFTPNQALEQVHTKAYPSKKR